MQLTKCKNFFQVMRAGESKETKNWYESKERSEIQQFDRTVQTKEARLQEL